MIKNNSITLPFSQMQIAISEGSNDTEIFKLQPLVKWAGGKEQELKYILPNLPAFFDRYFEPFVGGGAVYTAVKAQAYFINDKSEELIYLYNCLSKQKENNFFNILKNLTASWENLTALIITHKTFFTQLYIDFRSTHLQEAQLSATIKTFIEHHAKELSDLCKAIYPEKTACFLQEIYKNLFRKIKRMKMLETSKHLLPNEDIFNNIETAFKSAFYMYIRDVYNTTNKHIQNNLILHTALFLFIRNFAYSGMFRYNAAGAFNVPYGGIGYNRKNFQKKIEYLQSDTLFAHLQSTVIENLDFEDFLQQHQPQQNDFIFLDPPYDSEFSTYANNVFAKKDQIRLANYLIKVCKAQWMLIIKNTDFIYNLYANQNLNINSFEKNYLVSFMNRNDKNVEHLLITNY